MTYTIHITIEMILLLVFVAGVLVGAKTSILDWAESYARMIVGLFAKRDRASGIKSWRGPIPQSQEAPPKPAKYNCMGVARPPKNTTPMPPLKPPKK